MSESRSDSWLGCIVSVDCGETLGSFQGHVSAVDSNSQTISLIKAFRNGLQCQVPEITISACDIQNLEILKNVTEINKSDHSSIVCTSRNGHLSESPMKNGVNSRGTPSASVSGHRKGAEVRRLQYPDKEDDCLNTPISNFVLETEFDFEKNLALFDKQAVFGEIDATLKPGSTTARQQNKKYKCSEFVLEQNPTVMRPIVVPSPGKRQFVTDSDLLVPTVTLELRELLLDAAEKVGFSKDRQMEMVGRAASDMVLQLVGGSHRLNPNNSHQTPSAVLLCGSHRQGAQALCCGRHLANHGVKVSAYVCQKMSAVPSYFKRESDLFKLTEGLLTTSAKDLSIGPTDIIINALDDHIGVKEFQKNPRYVEAVKFSENCKAPVLTIDPPVEGVAIETKWSLSLVLPLDLEMSAGSVYLCDLAIPKMVFSTVGITYKSPFGPKCVIPLRDHDNL